MFRTLVRSALAAVTVAALGTAPTRAAFTVSAVVGGNSAVIADNNAPAAVVAGTVLNATDTTTGAAGVGIITTPSIPINPLTVPVNPFTVGGVQIGVSASSLALASQASLSTTSDVVVRNTTTGRLTLTLTISESAFTLPAGTGLMVLDHSLTIDRFYRADGSAYGLGAATPNSVASVGSASPNAVSTAALSSSSAVFSGANGALFNRTATPYSLTQTFTVALNAGEAVKFQGTVSTTAAVPVPATALAALAALPVFGGAGLFRRRRTA